MAITQVNNYMPGKNLARLTVNEDYDRLGDDRVYVTVDPGTVPATITVLEGSIIECNGNTYVLDADESFQMANAAHEYITFTDNPAPAFSSQAGPGTFDPELQGYYTGNARVLRFFIDQGGTTGILLLDNKLWDLTPMTLRFDRIRVYMQNAMSAPGVIQFNQEVYDNLSHFNIGTYRFTCVESGYFYIMLFAEFEVVGPTPHGSTVAEAVVQIRKNGLAISSNYGGIKAGANATIYHTLNLSVLVFLNAGDYIDGYIDRWSGLPWNSYSVIGGMNKTSMSIMRIE